MIAFWASSWIMSSEVIVTSVLRRAKLRELIVRLCALESDLISPRRHRHTRSGLALMVAGNVAILGLMTYLLRYSRDVEPLPLTDLDLMFFTYDIFLCVTSVLMAFGFLVHFLLDFSYINEDLMAITSSVEASGEVVSWEVDGMRRPSRFLRFDHLWRHAAVSSLRRERLASPARHIRSLAAKHLQLCELTLGFTSLFGTSMVLMTLGTFSASIILSYFIIQWLMSMVFVKNVSLLCYGIIGAISTTLAVVEMACLCSGVREKASNTGRCLSRALLYSKVFIIRYELELFSRQILETKVKFEPLGLINYDIKLLLSMSAAFVTHLSIVLQFQFSALNSQVSSQSQSNHTFVILRYYEMLHA
ncbi:uncharacterized protein LOC124162586 [Ischnura elegans]|uniref:uncharacterized protein LOC124162586 n=1 Tax=Ischnura elegans TaxID=197161 RepID=UPI001ED87327|nr:uncharacterized protein LOC124162586 [Ischnura elegans]